ncbi:MAG: hypothetical protein IT184_02705 [Acidobacteria bacterium]|nr:hypothetical protein [Acidobacteriota bacterium]
MHTATSATDRTRSRREWLADATRMLTAAAVVPFGAEATARARRAGGRIGFVDDNLDNYHANVYLKALTGTLQGRGFTLAGCTGLQEQPGRAWAAKNDIPYFPDVAALNAAVDFFMLLAPSTPETHLELCRRVLPLKKPTFVDKTFAPDFATARDIVALADRSGTSMQTSSALRYTNVQEEAKKLGADAVEHMITWGNGGSFGEYAIHPVELLISVMGPDAQRLMRRGTGDRSQLLIDFSGGRTGVVNVYTGSATPFAASLSSRKGTRYLPVDQARMFEASLSSTLDFFETGRPNVDRRETMAVMGILEASRLPEATERFVPIPR